MGGERVSAGRRMIPPTSALCLTVREQHNSVHILRRFGRQLNRISWDVCKRNKENVQIVKFMPPVIDRKQAHIFNDFVSGSLHCKTS